MKSTNYVGLKFINCIAYFHANEEKLESLAKKEAFLDMLMV